MSSNTAYSMSIFNGKNNFKLWKLKTKCILIQQHVYEAIDLSYAADESEEKKVEMNKTACSTIILSLSFSVLRKVGIMDSAKELWDKLHELYTENSIPSKLTPEELDVFTKFSTTSYGVTTFNGKNDFNMWKVRMKCMLILECVYEAVDLSYAVDESEEKKAYMNELACSIITLFLSNSVLKKVGTMDSAKELWDKLHELYTKTSMAKKLFLFQKLFRFKLDMGKDIDHNLDRFTKLVHDIKLTGDKHIDDITPAILLNALPDSYNDVKSAIKYGRDSVTLEIVVNCIKLKELELEHATDRDESYEKKGMQVRRRNTGKQNGGSSINEKTYRHKKWSKDNRRCYNCGEIGHYRKDCVVEME